MNDWTPEGSMAKTRHIYPEFIKFIQSSIQDLESKGHQVELAGILYHVGENEMSMPPYRQKAAEWLASTIQQSRIDLGLPNLKWILSQQPPTDHESVNKIPVTENLMELASKDCHTTLIQQTDLPKQKKQLVLDTAGIIAVGERLAEAVE